MCPIFFIRRYLWSKYGKEHYIIEKDTFIYYYDYKLFTSEKYIENKVNVNIGFVMNSIDHTESFHRMDHIHNLAKEKLVKLIFNLTNGKVIESNIMIKAKYMQDKNLK